MITQNAPLNHNEELRANFDQVGNAVPTTLTSTTAVAGCSLPLSSDAAGAVRSDGVGSLL